MRRSEKRAHRQHSAESRRMIGEYPCSSKASYDCTSASQTLNCSYFLRHPWQLTSGLWNDILHSTYQAATRPTSEPAFSSSSSKGYSCSSIASKYTSKSVIDVSFTRRMDHFNCIVLPEVPIAANLMVFVSPGLRVSWMGTV
jgi:hypothetical protein